MKKDWEIKKLGDICLIKGRIGFRGYTKSDLVKKGEGAITLSPSNIIDNKLNFSNCSYISWPKYEESPEIQLAVGDIVFCKTASIGKTAVINELPEKATLNPQFIVLKNIKCETQFLYYYLTCPSFKEKISQITTGTAVPTLSQSNFSNLPIALPPLEEQKRIVKILDEKFAQLETIKANAQTNLQNAKDLFQSQLTKAFSNTTWEKKTIGEVCSKRENIKWKNENSNTEYQYIDLSAVDRESKNISDTQIITKENAPSRAQQIVKTGDVLFGTTRPTLRRFCLLSDDYDGQICSTGFCVIRPNHNLVSPDWMFYQFYNEEFYKYIEPLQKGANYPAVTDKDIMNFIISIPSIAEQKRIVKELATLSEKVRQLQEIYTKQIANCDELKQSYLQKAFEGDL